MNKLEISERDVIVYREIYYETVKPMIMSGKGKAEIELGVSYMCEEFGITEEWFNTLHHIDLIQRIVSLGDDRMKVNVGGKEFTPSKESGLQYLPELKCPRRTTQK